MTDRQQSVYFVAMVFLFACGASLIVFKEYSGYYQQNEDIDLQGPITSVHRIIHSTTTPATSVNSAAKIIQ